MPCCAYRGVLCRAVLLSPQSRGNIVKVDRHKYVKVAYHGFRKLSSEERKQGECVCVLLSTRMHLFAVVSSHKGEKRGTYLLLFPLTKGRGEGAKSKGEGGAGS